MFQCICGKEYAFKRGLRKHERTSKLGCFSNRPLSTRETYENNKKKCLNCGDPIEYEKRENSFCNSSCSAIYNNPQKIPKPSKKCLSCGENIKRQNKYCDEKCSLAYRKSLLYQDVLNGNASSYACKKYLIEEYGNICLSPNCVWDFSKKTIDVELEHIDGNGKNNNLSNLTLLCPNCHSLTETYGSKNLGKSTRNYRKKYKKSYYINKEKDK